MPFKTINVKSSEQKHKLSPFQYLAEISKDKMSQRDDNVSKPHADRKPQSKVGENEQGERANTEIVIRRHKDVLCGRGIQIRNHYGNLLLHMKVKQYRPLYIKAKRQEKYKIARMIVNEIKAEGARFLKLLDDDKKSNNWVEVGDDYAYRKIQHALRAKNTGKTIENSLDQEYGVHALRAKNTGKTIGNTSNTPPSDSTIPISRHQEMKGAEISRNAVGAIPSLNSLNEGSLQERLYAMYSHSRSRSGTNPYQPMTTTTPSIALPLSLSSLINPFSYIPPAYNPTALIHQSLLNRLQSLRSSEVPSHNVQQAMNHLSDVVSSNAVQERSNDIEKAPDAESG